MNVDWGDLCRQIEKLESEGKIKTQAAPKSQQRPEVACSEWVEELESALCKVEKWHKDVKGVINEEADKWLNDLEAITQRIIATERKFL